MMTEAKMLALTKELARVKSRQDIAAALAIYHPDIELISPGFESTCRGQMEVKKGLLFFFALLPDYQVTLLSHACNGPMMLAVGEVSLTPRIPDHPCPRVSIPVFIEFHFNEERISKEIFGLDIGLICKKAAITPQQWTAAIANAVLISNVKEL